MKSPTEVGGVLVLGWNLNGFLRARRNREVYDIYDDSPSSKIASREALISDIMAMAAARHNDTTARGSCFTIEPLVLDGVSLAAEDMSRRRGA